MFILCIVIRSQPKCYLRKSVDFSLEGGQEHSLSIGFNHGIQINDGVTSINSVWTLDGIPAFQT